MIYNTIGDRDANPGHLPHEGHLPHGGGDQEEGQGEVQHQEMPLLFQTGVAKSQEWAHRDQAQVHEVHTSGIPTSRELEDFAH
eukprot:12547379-Heterocapsa_arctica.AAC.1